MDILDLQGKPVVMDKQTLNVADCCTIALLNVYPDEQSQTVQQKLLRYKLANKFSQMNGTVPSMSAEETAEVKVCVAKYWSPLVVGRVFEVIDPDSMK